MKNMSLDLQLLQYISILTIIIWLFVILYNYKKRLKIDRDEIGSWISLMSWFASRTIIFDFREDVAALYETGLSIQNYVQVYVTLFVVLWATKLVYRKRININSLTKGPFRWVTLLIILNILSTFWSIWPMLTLYRSVELLALYIIVLFIFFYNNWHIRLKYLMIFSLIISLIGGIIANNFNIFNDGAFIASIRSNSASMVAGAYLIYLIHSRLYLKARVGIINYSIAIILLLIFGSLTSFLATLLSVLYLVYYKADIRLRPIIFVFAISLIVVNVNMIYNTTTQIGYFFGKNAEHLSTLTGRLFLWEVIVDLAKKNPFGFGFAAAERLLAVQLSTIKKVQWAAFNAHNGYLATLIGVGWIGLSMLIYIFIITWKKVSYTEYKYNSLLIGLLILVLVNNFTIGGIGSTFSYQWPILIAVICATYTIPLQRKGTL